MKIRLRSFGNKRTNLWKQLQKMTPILFSLVVTQTLKAQVHVLHNMSLKI
jgi:hypothetical protein